VFSLAVSADYASDFTVYAGAGSGVYKTTDGGANWTAVSSGITTGYGAITSLAVSPDYAADQTVYAGTTYRGVFKSTDGGASWANSGISSSTIHSIAVSPDYGTDQTVYVGTGYGSPHGGWPSNGVFKSTDGGANWTTMNSGLPNNLSASSPTISISPNFAADRTVFAGANGFSAYSYTHSIPHPPVVSDIPDQTIAEGSTFATINLDDYVSDVDNTDAEMTWTHSGATELTVSINASRVATITIPNEDWNGSETITFTATDPGLLSDSDAAIFTVTPVNDPPVAADDSYDMYGSSLTVPAPGVLANDTDADGDPLEAVLVDPPDDGLVILNDDGSFTYTPGAGFTGLDSFTYKANDGTDDSNVATVTITHMLYVRNLNDSGDGSLRWTIDNANNHAGADTIVFSVAGTVNVLSPLPELNDTTGGTIIDGTTAPGYAGSPVVALLGPGTTTSAAGIQVTSADNELRALQVGSFRYGIQIWRSAAIGNVVTGCFVGNDGTSAVPNVYTGILIGSDAAGN
jgi:hypothetical protein